MIKLPKWVLTNPKPSIYDSESATAIEMVAKVYGATNELIEEYNKFAVDIEEKINTFINETNSDVETFKIGIRQEFQDFIDVVEIKLQTIENDVVSYSQNAINNAIQNGQIVITEVYNEETESLNMNVTGGV